MPAPTRTCATTCVSQDIAGISANVYRQDASTPSSNIVDGDVSTYSGPSTDNCADKTNECAKLFEQRDVDDMGSSITDFVELTLPQSYDVKKVYIQRRKAGTGSLDVQVYAKVGTNWEQCATVSLGFRNQEVICEKTTSIIRVTGIFESSVESFSFAEMKVSGC